MNCRKTKIYWFSLAKQNFSHITHTHTLSLTPKLFFFFSKSTLSFPEWTFLSSLNQQQNIISYIHRMLSARPVLRNAVRSASVAARSSARVVCITHILTNSMDWNKGWKRIFSIRRNQSLIHHQLRYQNNRR